MGGRPVSRAASPIAPAFAYIINFCLNRNFIFYEKYQNFKISTKGARLMKKNNKGFTLAELLIVVAIIAVLVAVSIPTFNNQLEKSR